MDAGEYRHARMTVRQAHVLALQRMPRQPDRASYHVHLRHNRHFHPEHQESDYQRNRPGAQERVQQRCPRVWVVLFLTMNKG